MVKQKIEMSPALNVNYLAFGKFFKMLLEDIVKGSTQISSIPSRAKLDAELRRTLIKGFEGIDFNDERNLIALGEMIETIWSKIDPIIRQQVKSHGNKFKKTIL